jgi:hypothetical protein
LLKVYVHPANEHDKWGGKALLEGMDLAHWPRARKVFVDWGYRGLREVVRGLGLELAVVAHPYAGVRGVWVKEASCTAPPEIPRVEGFKPLPKRWAVGGGTYFRLDGAEPAVGEGLRVLSRGDGGVDVPDHGTLTRKAARQGRLEGSETLLRQSLTPASLRRRSQEKRTARLYEAFVVYLGNKLTLGCSLPLRNCLRVILFYRS